MKACHVTFSPLYNNYNFNITTINSSRLFGFTLVGGSSGCLLSGTNEYLWDIRNGENISNILQNPFTIKKNDEEIFWQTVLKKGKEYFAYYDTETSCSLKDLKSSTHFEIITSAREEDGNKIGIDSKIVTKGASCYGKTNNEYAVSFSDIKTYVFFNSRFINYLSQLVENKLISTSLGNEILS